MAWIGDPMQTQKKACALPAETTQEQTLRQNIIEGCREMWDVYVETEREFHPLEEEVACANGSA